MSRLYHKIALAGVGLLGGSLGHCFQSLNLADEVTGYVRRQYSVEECLRVGAVTHVTLSVEEAFREADLVILCTPVAQMPVLARAMLPFLRPGTLVTDVGSTKLELVEALESIFLPAGVRYVGAHPMAGSEKTGPIHAYGDLFHNAICLLTPTERTDPEALARVKELWEKVGCKTAQVSPAEHDQLVCRASHLPHILATALVDHVLGQGRPLLQAKVCASGFRDTTRVASGSPEMWRDIVLNNNGPLVREIEAYIETLQRLKTTLGGGNPEEIFDLFSRVRELRNDWLDQRTNGWNS